MKKPDKKRYPIGYYLPPKIIDAEMISRWIETITTFPKKIRSAVESMTDQQLDTKYREGGWTIRQVVHHCADSHMNSICRFKLALTEDNPTIRPYIESKWAELEDSQNFPIDSSLLILDGVHSRMSALLSSLNTSDMSLTYIHPEHNYTYRLDFTIGMYAWHCNHHLAHIQSVNF